MKNKIKICVIYFIDCLQIRFETQLTRNMRYSTIRGLNIGLKVRFLTNISSMKFVKETRKCIITGGERRKNFLGEIFEKKKNV